MDFRRKKFLVLITVTICVIFVFKKRNSDNIFHQGPGKHVKAMPFRYPGAKLSFKEEKDLIASMKLPPSKFTSLTPDVLHNFTFVTAASANHFKESMDSIASVQTHFPGYKIIYFDIGLKPDQITMVKTLCQVEYRAFPWAKYPRLPREPLFYAGWKALSIQEALVDHPAVFWIDAAIRFVSPMPESVISKIKQSGGVLLFNRVGHSTYAVTHPSMYNYLPTNITILKKTGQLESGAMMFYQTKDIYYNVLWWFYLCSLEVQCISPTNSRFLAKGDLKMDYLNAHRFDQSAINLILLNHFGYNDKAYVHKTFYNIIRRPSFMYNVTTCSTPSK